jgi:hypothetical protein
MQGVYDLPMFPNPSTTALFSAPHQLQSDKIDEIKAIRPKIGQTMYEA